MIIKKTTIFISLFCLFSISTFAETIILKSGKVVTGKIIEETDAYIKIDISGIPITYYSDEIQSIGNEDTYSIKFDGRNWHIGHHQDLGNQEILEYVLEGESIENWSELITGLRYEGINNPLQDIANGAMEKLKNKYASLEWHIIEENSNSLILEWQNHAYPHQHEIKRFFKSCNTILIVSYVKKTEQLDKDKRDKWIDIIKTIQFR